MKINAIELYHVSVPYLLRNYGKRFFKLTETRLKLKVIREKGLKAALELKSRKEGDDQRNFI